MEGERKVMSHCCCSIPGAPSTPSPQAWCPWRGRASALHWCSLTAPSAKKKPQTSGGSWTSLGDIIKGWGHRDFCTVLDFRPWFPCLPSHSFAWLGIRGTSASHLISPLSVLVNGNTAKMWVAGNLSEDGSQHLNSRELSYELWFAEKLPIWL